MRFLRCLFLVFLIGSAGAFAQNQLDYAPLDLQKDPDIDLFIGDWQNSIPFNSHGSITERAVLTKSTGDPLKPVRKGAVLTQANRLSRATIDPHVSTVPTKLKSEQEVFFVESGEGIITAAGNTAELRSGIFVLVPEGLEFTMTNTGNKLLVMYLINEPVPAGFTPKKELVVKDEKAMPFRDSGYLKVHWSHNGKNVLTTQDGLATLKAVNYITFEPMSIGQPHSHAPEKEEVWLLVEGEYLLFLGKEIRWQNPGCAYKIPPNGTTPHSNINPTGEPARFLYFSRL
ncbi:MAG: cupin domain-containing protein [Candidatus Latescibacterota bacterium]